LGKYDAGRAFAGQVIMVFIRVVFCFGVFIILKKTFFHKEKI
jgi:hypothetical protein